MKTLQETIKESIFDKDLATNDEAVVVKSWLDMYMPEGEGKWGLHWKIDVDKKIIRSSLKYINNSSLIVKAENNVFDGFLKGYKFLTEDSKSFDKLSLIGQVEGVENIPDGINEISIYQPRNLETVDRVIDDINKQVKRLKSLMFLDNDWRIGWKSINLSKLSIPVTTLYIGAVETDAPVKFNANMKVEILQIGYGSENGTFKNLSIFKTLSFQAADFKGVKEWIEKIEDHGKSNFDKIIINGRNLNKEEKDAVKGMLKGDESIFDGYDTLITKCDEINRVLNDKDGTKDRFGESLQPGDIVIVCNSTDPKYPSFLDIYKGCSQNGRIRTDKQMMAPSRNVIKLNNPKILDLLK